MPFICFYGKLFEDINKIKNNEGALKNEEFCLNRTGNESILKIQGQLGWFTFHSINILSEGDIIFLKNSRKSTTKLSRLV